MLQSDTMECSINVTFLTGCLERFLDQPNQASLDISKPLILADTDIATDILMLLQMIYESRVSLLKRFTVL